MELPDDVLAQINDYSKPVTRPGWRKLHILTNQRFYMEIMKLKDEWWRRDGLIYRRLPLLHYDKLMRRYIMRYNIHLMSEFEWDETQK